MSPAANRQTLDLLGEYLARTTHLRASEAPHPRLDPHRLRTDRGVGQTALVMAMHSVRALTAVGHDAALPRALAPISITTPTRTIRSMTTPARCGNRTRQHLESHSRHDHARYANLIGNTRNISITECVPEPGNLAVDRMCARARNLAVDRSIPDVAVTRGTRMRCSRPSNIAPMLVPYADLPASVDVEDACRWLLESRPWSSAADRVIVAAPVGGRRGQTVNRTVRRGGPSPVESGPDNAGRPVRYGSGSRRVDTATAAVVSPPWWIGAGAFASN